MISEEAKKYLAENLPVREGPLPATDNIVELRREIFAECESAVDPIREELQPQLNDIEIGGVACLEITPASTNKKLDDVALLYFFGGGYITGSPEEDLPIAAVIADRLGVRTVCPRYRLAPEYPYPEAIEDGMAVYESLLLKLSPHRLLLCGESAGGNLTMQTLLRGNAKGLPMPAGIALLSPWVDLSNSGDSLAFNDGRDPSLTAEWVAAGSAMFAPGQDLTSPDLSPLYATFPDNFPPALITSGSRDLLLSHCTNLSRQMRRAKIDVELRVWEEMWHVFEWYPQLPEARESLVEISDFLGSCLDKTVS